MDFYTSRPEAVSNAGGEVGRYIWLSQSNIDFTLFDHLPIDNSDKDTNEGVITAWSDYYDLMVQHRELLPTELVDDMLQYESGIYSIMV